MIRTVNVAPTEAPGNPASGRFYLSRKTMNIAGTEAYLLVEALPMPAGQEATVIAPVDGRVQIPDIPAGHVLVEYPDDQFRTLSAAQFRRQFVPAPERIPVGTPVLVSEFLRGELLRNGFAKEAA
jgi:hypothetical protein